MPQVGVSLAVSGAVAAVGWAAGRVLGLNDAPSANLATSAATASQSPALSGHQINTRSSRVPLPIPYGEFITGVNVTFRHVENPYLYLICEIGEGEINGIVRQDGTIWSTTATMLPGSAADVTTNPPLLYIDGTLFNDATMGGHVWAEWHSGSSTQSVNSKLQAAYAGWDQTLRYTSYLMLRIGYDKDTFNSEPEVTVKIQGAKIYNPVAAATAYTNNPALCAYDYLTRSSQRGGIGIAAARLDTTTLSTAIDYCTAKGWTCNMPIGEQRAVADNLRSIFANFRGDIIQSADKLKIKFLDLNYESVVMSLGESDVIANTDGFSTLEITQPDTGARPNAIKATHLSSEIGYKPDDIIIPDPVAIAAEGDLREHPINLYGLSEPELVQKMSNYWLERLRLNKTVAFTATSRAMALESMDLVYFDHTMPDWEDKIFRVLSCPVNGDHTVSLSLIEEHSIFYDDIYNLTAHYYDDTDLPGPNDPVQGVINVSHSEETYYYRNRSFTRWLIDFDAPAAVDYPWWDYANIWLKIGSGGEWRFMTTCDTNYQVDPVEEGETYFLKIQSVSVFGKKEDFDNCIPISNTMVGVTDAPGDLAGISAIANGDSVSIYGIPLSNPDIEGYEIRLGDTWDGGIFISFNKSISLRLNGVRPGTHKFWAAAKSNAGIYSVNPVSATVTVFIPPGYTALDTETWDYSTGTFDNTEQTTYDATDSLKCSHTAGVLTGTWTSPSWNLGAIETFRVWGDFLTGFVSSDTTWDGVYPFGTTGSNLLTDGAFDNWTADELDDWNEVYCDAAEDVSGETGSAAQLTMSDDYGYIYDTVTVTAENSYIARGYYKNTAGDTAIFKVHDMSNSWDLTPGWVELETSTNFTSLSFNFETPPGCISVGIMIGGLSNTDIVWFDTISIYEVDDSDTTTWEDVDAGGTMTWTEIFNQTTAAQLSATLRHKELIGDSWTENDYFEILCAEIEAQYVSVVVTITDPSQDSNIYLKELNMIAREGPQ